MSKLKTYLGDSVYVDYGDGGLLLTTENDLPDDPSNVIFLELSVWQALVRYAEERANFI
jgi:hypothetical protein